MSDLPDAHFGVITEEQEDQVLDSTDDLEVDDDEELKETPPDVVEILGFDPLEKDND